MIHIQLVNDDKNALILLEKLFELKLLVNIGALEHIDKLKVDVVFLDIDMPHPITEEKLQICMST